MIVRACQVMSKTKQQKRVLVHSPALVVLLVSSQIPLNMQQQTNHHSKTYIKSLSSSLRWMSKNRISRKEKQHRKAETSY
jgi:hypothetical protein